MNNFKLVMIILFVFGAVLGVFIFAGFINLDKASVVSGPTGTVTLWGTATPAVMNPIIDDINNNNTFKIKYVRIGAQTFEQDLLEAIALDQGPDLFFLEDNLAFKYSNKIYPIPYTSYPLVTFKNNFVNAGEVFLDSRGILALPITVDPLMLYYNRTMLDSNNIIYPPSYWDEFTSFVKTFTKKDINQEIIQSAFALGQFSNISHAKYIISTLFMQTGNPIVERKDFIIRSTINEPTQNPNNPTSSLAFYTSFSDPLKPNYSWNKSLPLSIDSFSKEDLAFYFGFASDLQVLLNKNPNQDFQVAPVPQLRNSNFKTTSAKVTGIAVSAFSNKKDTALAALYKLADVKYAEMYSFSQYVPPARRDLLAKNRTDSYFPVFYSSALFARSWLDPSATDSNNIFRGMVEQVLSNAREPEDAILNANNRLNLLLLNN